ncbi:anthranilate synthase component 1 [Buchnera aphidicola]|uniref:anthranilate synthase component 1 n=1 Tax=Buchnera aphidicola TaxID=9 RepID=UPI00094C476B|nr:anthranilate synthase component 1 [Buchnera aphidicola]
MSKLCAITSWTENTHYHADPTQIFHQLCGGKMNTLLLESSGADSKQQLTSKIIIDSALRITAAHNTATLTALTDNGECLLYQLDAIIPKNIFMSKMKHQRIVSFPSCRGARSEESKRLMLPSIFDCFRWLLRIAQNTPDPSASLFCGGLFAYDLIHSFESVPRQRMSIAPCPDICFYLAESVLHINHKQKTALLQAYVFSSCPSEKKRLSTRMKQLHRCLQRPELPPVPQAPQTPLSVTGNISDTEYAAVINHLRTYIDAGEIFQVVPSRQFYCLCTHPLPAYHLLKQQNPSPYMFFMQDSNFTLFGASPESYLQYNANSRVLALHPIAGTRPRGFSVSGAIDLDLDNRIELSLRTHRKELSEHLMLVDLARNDLAKVCCTNSRYVSQLMRVEKYSHVMHLVSHVTGTLKKKLDIFHAYQSCMNMGTLTGAPKLRAMQLIAQAESTPRGSYGGSVGYLTGDGSLDTCIVIRSAFVKKDVATVQSGAGIVHESLPAEEVQESKNKAQAVLQSIFHAHQMNAEQLYV